MKIKSLIRTFWVEGQVSEVSADDAKAIHLKDDVDFAPSSHHHTIGDGEFQVASGAALKRLEERVKALEDAP